ncbi:hypothetical protein GA0070624_1003 [Micromonospora rhizosphaerae]|uniref:Redoxin domain-containing protein n=1 Tax=Micromonospora rhizosphaerae TaxID=568872 RepID=A0A1C6RGS3_9ACTN|nr:hypothetical protein GA0070624_1003 [Micromonospora rhizosphaerae]
MAPPSYVRIVIESLWGAADWAGPVRQTEGMSARVRAPELRGRGWLNTGGRDLKLSDLRGRILLIDFGKS